MTDGVSDAPFRHLLYRIYSRAKHKFYQIFPSLLSILPREQVGCGRPVCRIMYTYTCSIQRGIHRARSEQNGRIARPFSFHGEGGRAQTLFAPQCIPTDGRRRRRRRQLPPSFRACSSIHYGEQLARQPVSGRSGGVVVKGGREEGWEQ